MALIRSQKISFQAEITNANLHPAGNALANTAIECDLVFEPIDVGFVSTNANQKFLNYVQIQGDGARNVDKNKLIEGTNFTTNFYQKQGQPQEVLFKNSVDGKEYVLKNASYRPTNASDTEQKWLLYFYTPEAVRDLITTTSSVATGSFETFVKVFLRDPSGTYADSDAVIVRATFIVGSVGNAPTYVNGIPQI